MEKSINQSEVHNIPDQKPKQYNKNLFRRIVLDCCSGFLGAFSVAPVMLMVDKAVVQRAAGQNTILNSCKKTCINLIKHPIKFVGEKSFKWILLVYGSTYMTANSIDSVSRHYDLFNNSINYLQLFGVTFVNMFLSILKDRAFAKIYGKEVTKVPVKSLAIWFLRDVLTIAAAFTLPGKLAEYISQNYNLSKTVCQNCTQFTCPIVLQLVSTPLHLFGYDMCFNLKSSAWERVHFLQANYVPSTSIRMVRMMAAYGIGGINNKFLRDLFIKPFEGPDWNKGNVKSSMH